MLNMKKLIFMPFIALALVILLTRSGFRKGREDDRINVVLIILDTVRASSTQLYGGELPNTPNLIDLAEDGIVFTNAFGTTSWTLPSVASMYTGLYPYEHGAHGYKKDGVVIDHPLDFGHDTLAEIFSEAGYSTIGVTSNTGFMREEYGLHQGFAFYYVKQVLDRSLVNTGLTELNGRDKSRPFFAMFTFMDAHIPYNCEEIGFGEIPTNLSDGFFHKVMSRNPDPDDLRILKMQYENGIAHVDAAVGMVVDWLRKKSLYDNTLIIAVGDHGEYLGEHDLLEHAKGLHKEVIHIPLIVKPPNSRTGSREDRLVSVSQIFSTVLEFAGMENPTPGSSPSLMSEDDSFVVLSQLRWSRKWDMREWGHRFPDEKVAIMIDARTKLVWSSIGNHELFLDQNEYQNHYDSSWEKWIRLVEREYIFPDTTLPEKDVVDEMDEEARRELETLGYL